MDRAEARGFGIAVAGHVALLAALTWGLTQTVIAPPSPPAMEVSFVDDVALTAASPQPSVEPPARATAPDIGPTEDAAPAPAPLPAPTPPAPRRAEPAPSPDPAAAKPVPAPPRATPGTEGRGERTRRSRLGDDLLRGIGRDPAPSRNANPPGAVMSAKAAADIASAISRQIQPCADRQVYPGPGAERIVTPIILRLNRDGSLAARPRVGRQRGLDDENDRYAQRVADLAINSFVSCSPLRGLPPDLYDVPRGWSNFTMNYRLPG